PPAPLIWPHPAGVLEADAQQFAGSLVEEDQVAPVVDQECRSGEVRREPPGHDQLNRMLMRHSKRSLPARAAPDATGSRRSAGSPPFRASGFHPRNRGRTSARRSGRAGAGSDSSPVGGRRARGPRATASKGSGRLLADSASWANGSGEHALAG